MSLLSRRGTRGREERDEEEVDRKQKFADTLTAEEIHGHGIRSEAVNEWLNNDSFSIAFRSPISLWIA